MVKYKMGILVAFCLVFGVQRSQGRTIDALVSTDWLETHLNDPNLVVLDVRPAEEYTEEEHIPSSISSPFTTWWVIRDGIIMELPEEDDLRDKIGALGITSSSKVVLVNSTSTDFSRGDGTRVAWTLIYAGISDVAIVNGGFNKWVEEGKPVTDEIPTPIPVPYTGSFKECVLISKNQVMQRLYTAAIIDARVAADFYGVAPLEFSSKEGHIFNARSLPAPEPWAFTSDGLFKDDEDLGAMVAGVIPFGPLCPMKKIIYCGVGGYGSIWWYLISEVLGYKNVSLYDGSMQEWTLDPNAPVVRYHW